MNTQCNYVEQGFATTSKVHLSVTICYDNAYMQSRMYRLYRANLIAIVCNPIRNATNELNCSYSRSVRSPIARIHCVHEASCKMIVLQDRSSTGINRPLLCRDILF